MSVVSAAAVKELREKTGAGMMDCKTALSETNADIEAAVDWLRKKGLAKAAKKSGRVAAEGLVAIKLSGTQGVAVEVNSETDFVARNADFQTLVSNTASLALDAKDESVEHLLEQPYPTGGVLKEAIATAIATIGENMTLRRAAKIQVKAGIIASYIHGQVADGQGKIAVLVGLDSTGKADVLAEIGRRIAMHVAATNPVALTADGIPADVIAREKAVLADKNAGKPPHVLEKIIESGLKTYFKEVCLLDQPFIHDPSKTVSQALKDSEGAAGAPITLSGFVRYGLGEGIEKQESDFAAEVNAAAGIAP